MYGLNMCLSSHNRHFDMLKRLKDKINDLDYTLKISITNIETF